jgi:hypothetical protein
MAKPWKYAHVFLFEDPPTGDYSGREIVSWIAKEVFAGKDIERTRERISAFCDLQDVNMSVAIGFVKAALGRSSSAIH